MYTIESDGIVVYDPRIGNERGVSKAVLKLALNNSGSLDFTCVHGNAAIDSIHPMKSNIKVYRDDECVFSGRVVREKVDMLDNHSYTCEGFLSYLHDTMVEPYEANTDNVYQFLQRIVENHNAQLEEALGNTSRNLTVGIVNATDSQGIVREALENYSQSWDIVKKRLIDSDINGFFISHPNSSDNTFDFVNEFTERNDQSIVFSKNIIEIGTVTDCSKLFTAVMPIGADNITIAPVEDGMINEHLRKRGYNVENVDLIDKFGYIVKPIVFYDVDDRQELIDKAIEEMETVYFPDVISASALDLNVTNKQIESFDIGKINNVIDPIHHISRDYVLSAIQINLLNPSVGSKLSLWGLNNE